MKFTVSLDNTPKRYWARVLAGVATILLLDALWLGFMTSYTDVYSVLTKEAAAVSGAIGILLYAVVAACVGGVFVSNAYRKAAAAGALLGFLVFSVYNLTTFATISGWTPRKAAIDTAYGTVAWTILLTVQHAAAS